MPRSAAIRIEPWAWRWPLPAVGAWLAAWALFAALRPALGAAGALGAATGLGLALAWPVQGRWRQLLVAAGFPLSAMAAGPAALPPWVWGGALLAASSVYPLRAWRDAPLFPTPAGALDPVAAALALPGGARVLDAGCGLGHGLRALHRAWPQATVFGIEWSWLLALYSRLRCPWARVRQGDLWAGSWQDFDLVYVFQRPESMARLLDKAQAEMRPGSWLISLAFDLPCRPADRSWPASGGHRVHAWRMPAQPGGPAADISR
jgi:hypothetical protein